MGAPLFSEQGTAAVPDAPALVGGRCRCGQVFFPMQSYGCERCGRHGEALECLRLSGRGKLRAVVLVHLHNRPSPKAPFVVGVVALEDGPAVRTLIEPPVDGLRPGVEMVAVLVDDDGDGRALRFAAASQGGR